MMAVVLLKENGSGVTIQPHIPHSQLGMNTAYAPIRGHVALIELANQQDRQQLRAARPRVRALTVIA